jgi:hypothetical protein
MWENILKNEFYYEEAIVDRIIIPKLMNNKVWRYIINRIGYTSPMKSEVLAPLSIPPDFTLELLPWLRLNWHVERKSMKIKTEPKRVTHTWKNMLGTDVVYSFSIKIEELEEHFGDIAREQLGRVDDNEWLMISGPTLSTDIDKVIDYTGAKLENMEFHHKPPSTR